MKLAVLPFLNWIPDMKLSWKQDVIAGVLVSIVLIPQSLAYSQMAGMPAYYGLYASFIPLIVASLWGSSRILSTGPAVIISLLSLGAVSKLTPISSSEFITYSAVLAVMVGVIQLLMGVFKFGNIINFVSGSVILGFINATSILIMLSQAVKIFGLPSVTGQHEIFSLVRFINGRGEVNLESIVIGIGALILLLSAKRIGFLVGSRFPLPLLIISIATIYSKLFDYSGAVVGEIPAGLPSFVVPIVSFEVISALFLPSFVVALVAYMNSISLAKSFGAKSKEVVVGNKELIGQGLANIFAGFFGSSAVSGSVSRTAINYSAGAKTNLSSIVTGIMVGVVLLFFTDALKYVPQTVLAAIIIASVITMVDLRKIWRLFVNYKYDGLVAVFSFVATLIVSPNLELGVIIGIIISGIVYVHRSSYSKI